MRAVNGKRARLWGSSIADYEAELQQLAKDRLGKSCLYLMPVDDAHQWLLLQLVDRVCQGYAAPL
jgi:hypothetical protein